MITSRTIRHYDEALARGTICGVDLSPGRLSLAARDSPVQVAQADARALPLSAESFDGIIFPYSMFQLLRGRADRIASLSEAARVLRADGTIWIDVSDSFEHRPSTARQQVARGWSAALNAHIVEWETLQRLNDRLRIEKEFEIGDGRRVAVTEEWTFRSALKIDNLAVLASLEVSSVDRGYAPDSSPHRQIFALKRCDHTDTTGPT